MSKRAPLLPPPYNTERALLEREVEIETYRASGPGGQHVNKTSSAVRLVHPASGVVVIARDSPSQYRNRAIAFERLIERLHKLNYIPKKRVKTKPSAASRQRRLEQKKRLGLVKRQRSKVGDD